MKVLCIIKNCIRNKGRYKYTIFAALSFFSLLFIIIGKAYPAYEEHLRIEQECRSLEQKLEILEQFAVRNKDYANIKEQHENSIAKLREKLPASLENTNAMERLQQNAKKNGISLNTKRIEIKDAKTKAVTSVGVELKAFGSYRNIIDLLVYIENNSLAGLDNVKLESLGNDGLALSGKCYYYAM